MQKEAEEAETALLAEFASELSSWTDKEAILASGFHEIEDIIDGEFLYFLRAADLSRADSWLLTCFFVSSVLADFFPGHSQAAIQAIEVDREGRRAEGAEIVTDAPPNP